MPKALSLKKVQQAANSKNQKAITHFFKQTNTQASQNHKISPNITQSSANEVDQRSKKRKASSPILLGTIDHSGDDCVLNDHNTPKKLKSRKFSTEESPSKNHSVKKSPGKENIVKDKISPRKHIILNENFGPSDSLNGNSIDRLPLTPIKGIVDDEDEIDDRININKSSTIENGNHVPSKVKVASPKKVVKFDKINENILPSYHNAIRTPKKNPEKEFPRANFLKTQEGLSKDELSPSKSGSTVKTIEDSPHTLDGFGDQWDLDDVDENSIEDLDLMTMQRCEIVSVTQHPGSLELRLKNATNHRCTCFVDGIWLNTPLVPGEIISVMATRNSSGKFFVSNTSGLISLRPDHLISSTSVVAGVFCQRKAVLQERWRGLDSANTSMIIGILIHELVQKALTQNIMDITKLRTEASRIIKESTQMLYDAGLCEEEAQTNMQQYLSPLSEFMQIYVAKSPLSKQPPKDQWKGHIDKVLDIEENVCCPQLGLKGKIDATLQVTIHDRKGRQRSIVPLELKSGKASVSAEHRGQLVLYGMMLSLLRYEDPTTAANIGLLLYLKERVDLREVSCGYPERRDLVMLRNQLVQYLAGGPQDVDPEQLNDIEDASCMLQQKLPEPVNHQTACAKCPYLTICSLHLWHTDGPSVSESHPLTKLRDQAIGHLSIQHVQYFLQWAALLRMEEQGQKATTPLHTLWTDTAEKRLKRGTCAANLKLISVEQSGDKYLHVFERQIKEIDTLNSSSQTTGPQEGEFSIVSTDARPWIAAGVVSVAKERNISILLERDLSNRSSEDVTFHIDTYESHASTVQNLTNLGVLLEDSDRSARLRKLIIDKEVPEFDKKLPREVGRLGSRLMRTLNIEQQRAVLKALSAKDYALLQGLPGTGKTQTISVLIQMLVGLKQRVLVTAHTHSAVDTVLSRLPESLKIIRLGSSSRIAPCLLNRCEQQLASNCQDAKQLEELYNSMEVVGVTCLGAAHAMLQRTTFDVCIVDEATQVLQTTVLRPLFAAVRFVLVGDPEQLPPVVRSRAARRLGMEESLFHRLINEDVTSTLQLQYRMNQALTNIANKVAYNSRLKCADQQVAEAKLDVKIENLSLEPSWIETACSPGIDNAAVFLEMATVGCENNKTSKSCTNVDEACVVMTVVNSLIKRGVKPSDIGIIAPYRDQVALLRRVMLPRGVECSTVDQFQGRDKSVILYSCTKRDMQDERKIKEDEILNDKRRLAVSVTRAKHKLIVVGDSRALERYLPIQRLIEACKLVILEKQDVVSIVNKHKNDFL